MVQISLSATLIFMMHCTSLHILKMFILYSTMCQESKKKKCHGHVFKNYIQSGKWKLFNNGKKSSEVINFVVDIF